MKTISHAKRLQIQNIIETKDGLVSLPMSRGQFSLAYFMCLGLSQQTINDDGSFYSGFSYNQMIEDYDYGRFFSLRFWSNTITFETEATLINRHFVYIEPKDFLEELPLYIGVFYEQNKENQSCRM